MLLALRLFLMIPPVGNIKSEESLFVGMGSYFE
jgi:hypothetical protein